MAKTIFITGASSGIGRALASQWAAPHNTLILVARNIEQLLDVKKNCEQKGATVHVLQADLSSMGEVEKLSNQLHNSFAHIDILVNNAGISQRSLAEETSEKVDRQIMELNFFAPVKLTKLLWPLLLKSAHANIVNISSVTGTFGFPQRSAYAASKHAMEGFFESWMLENKHPNIYFTTVAPGRIYTNISYNALKQDGTKHQTLDEGQAKGIKPEVCAQKIIRAVHQNKRKAYIVQQERILLFLHRFSHSMFVLLVKKLGLQ
jgi:dehydrogenase/reductase SDR family member 7B